MCRWTFDSFDIDILSRKNFEGKASFYADNDQYGVLSLLRPQHVTHGTTRHYETQAFNPLLNAPPWSYVVYPSSYGGLVYSVLSGVERAMEDDSPISFSP